MAKKGGQQVLQEEINNNDDWAKMLEKTGIYIVDIYTEWCGPCVPMIANLKKIKLEIGNDNLFFAIAKSDYITALERFRQKSEPHWMFFFDGKLANLIIDANAPRLMKVITYEVEQYDKFKKGEIQREFIPLNKITEEERIKMIEYEEYKRIKMKKEKKIRDERMMKVKKHTLRKFAFDVQFQSCVVFFPHTVEYIMVEKPPEEGAEEPGEDDEPREPVMMEKRVCEVANACAFKYEELIVIEAREIQLTEDTLNEIFFLDEKILESFPSDLIDQLLSKKLYTVMLSMPTAKDDDTVKETAAVDEAEPIDHMGEVEQKLSTIIYGNGDPLTPNQDSFAEQNMIVNSDGVRIPSLYTPNNPLSKVAALTVLFQNFCANNGYVKPKPPSPQYVIMLNISKINMLLPIIEELGKKIVHYGFFSSVDPNTTVLLSKDAQMLFSYGIDKIDKNAVVIISVLEDDNDKSLLRVVEVGPFYVSTNSVVGIDDAAKYFPHNYDQMDGEVKLWLAQQTAQEETIDGEGFGEDYTDASEGEDEESSPSGEEQQPSSFVGSTVTAVG